MHPATQPAASTFSFSRFVEDVRLVAPATGDALHVEWLPDGRTSLVFRVLEGGRRGDVSVVGPRTRALFKNATGVERAVIVRFKPGWSAPLLGVAANALTDQIVPLQDLWGFAGGDLCRELLAAPSLPEMRDRLAHAFAVRSRPPFEPASARLARQAVRLLEGDEVRVESVAERLGVTARHLRRAFTESVGIGPKEFARTVRLQRAVRTAAATSHDWGRIAVDAGYYDQAHLIADFRELVGLTPGAFARRGSDRGTPYASRECAAACPAARPRTAPLATRSRWCCREENSARTRSSDAARSRRGSVRAAPASTPPSGRCPRTSVPVPG